MKRSLLITGAVTALGVSSLVGVTAANAATTTSTSDPMSSLVTKLAEKFNLNKTDVQAVFDEQRTAMEAQREQEFKDTLTQAVKDGKLTQEQADKITAKRAELQAARDANQDKTETERRAAMKTEMEALKTWATENGIDMQYLRPMGGHGGHHGLGGTKDDTSSTDSSTTQ